MIKKEFLKDFATKKAESIADLYKLCDEIRAKILSAVSQNGGHLSSSLGAVEIIVAMHFVFDSTKHPFIFDVSHQAYAHKLLTGRSERFHTLRQFGGISGFCSPSESPYDFFVAGHSSTSISLGVGATKAKKLLNDPYMPIALIGDGALSAGLAFEAFNELGHLELPMIIILNDNEMSISKPIGAISNAISQALSHRHYQGFRGWLKNWLSTKPSFLGYLAKRFEESFKLITPGGILFEEMGLKYIGPIDGHNLEALISTLKKARDMNAPVIIHAKTTKGKGYTMAEGKYEKWHGVGAFDLETGLSKTAKKAKSPTDIFSESLLKLAKKDKKIVGVTAAMPTGTGMDKLMDVMPERFFDVAIAEQHAVTSMASMARLGFKPFVAIYSTFLQRGFDQIIHDVGIMRLPVRFAIDRAGIVGEDGETHQGLLDIAYLRAIPNMTLFAPRDNATLESALLFASKFNSGPCAFRYPRAKFVLDSQNYQASEFQFGKAEVLKRGDSGVLLVGYGNGVGRAEGVRQRLEALEINATLLDLRFLKPLDSECLKAELSNHKHILVFSDNYKMGGVASALAEFASEQEITAQIHSFEIEDVFIPHGATDKIEKLLGIDTESLTQKTLQIINAKTAKITRKIRQKEKHATA